MYKKNKKKNQQQQTQNEIEVYIPKVRQVEEKV